MSFRKLVCCTAVAAAVGVGALQAQDAARGNASPAPQVQGPMAGRGMGMMAERQKMMANMAAAQKKLDELVVAMNAATGQAKVDQMALVITELVAQRKAMQARMMSMQDAMMKQMAQPPQPGSAVPTPDPSTGAPPAAPGPGHEHHE